MNCGTCTHSPVFITGGWVGGGASPQDRREDLATLPLPAAYLHVYFTIYTCTFQSSQRLNETDLNFMSSSTRTAIKIRIAIPPAEIITIRFCG